MAKSRIIVWFSCGAASAVAAKLATDKYRGMQPLYVVNCDTLKSEHRDNARFARDVSEWIRWPITTIRSAKFIDVDDVFERTRYMSGQKGARCTTEMKKVPRMVFQQADDVHIFGYTVDEKKRIQEFTQRNPELNLEWNLRDAFVRKEDCYRTLEAAGVKLPEMYSLGFDHNNCLGCVKATSPAYWQRVAKHFPETFARRARQSRDIGARLVRVDGIRIFLDEMDLARKYKGGDGDIDCGPYCQQPDRSPLPPLEGKGE